MPCKAMRDKETNLLNLTYPSVHTALKSIQKRRILNAITEVRNLRLRSFFGTFLNYRRHNWMNGQSDLRYVDVLLKVQ